MLAGIVEARGSLSVKLNIPRQGGRHQMSCFGRARTTGWLSGLSHPLAEHDGIFPTDGHTRVGDWQRSCSLPRAIRVF